MTGLDVLAFLGELVLLAALTVAGARTGTGGWSVPLAVALPVLLAVVWGRWLAPRAARPLSPRARLSLKAFLVAVTAGLLAVCGLPGVGLGVLLGVGAVLVAGEWQPAGRDHRERG